MSKLAGFAYRAMAAGAAVAMSFVMLAGYVLTPQGQTITGMMA
ncbi:MAG: hypothetical protein N2Z59_02110 [Alteraurantiacibacter sp.]|nr:hypothetical protein [Alteraurantiacibacter sp.]